MTGLALFRADPACTPADFRLFFGRDGEEPDAHQARAAEAKALCASCPAHVACLAYATRNGIRTGIWGGVDLDPLPVTAPDGSPLWCSKSLHLLTPANTYVRPGTDWRYCRACRRDREGQQEVAA